MAFQDFDDLARVGLKRAPVHESAVFIRSEAPTGKTATTSLRFSQDLIDKAGWHPGQHRLKLQIDPVDRVLRLTPTKTGGYKLIDPRSGSPFVKFSVAPGMPLTRRACQATDVVVAAGDMLLVLPQEVDLLGHQASQLTSAAQGGRP